MASIFSLLFPCFKRRDNTPKTKPGEPTPATASVPAATEDALKPAEIVTIEDKSDSTLYALIIGINDYPKLKPLAGAVPDADQMAAFLAEDLGVPPNHINNLRNETASRDGIINAFQSLRDDPRIKKGDPILIYYAGHGGSAKATDEWKVTHGAPEVQVIFPFDYDLELPGSSELVNCIPDVTIASLLNQLAREKGDNITVIFDSCHSASGNRNTDSSRREPRCADVKLEIPGNIDHNILSPTSDPDDPEDSRHTGLPLCTNQTSHVHFAACGADELAWEDEGRGAFTSILLRTIRANGVDKITYHNLMLSLPMLPKQSPHCYGKNKDRILFNSRVPSRKVTFIPVKSEQGVLTLQAGAGSGVTFQSIWELHESIADNSPALGRFRAQSPNVSTTILEPENADTPLVPSTAGRLYARLVRAGPGNELKVWFSPEAKQLIFPDSETGSDTPGSTEHEIGYVVHPAQDSADLAVELYHSSSPDAEPEVTFRLCDHEAEQYGVAALEKRKPARREQVETVLFAAAKWRWHLRRTGGSQRTTMQMEMMKIAEKDSFGNDVYLPRPYKNLNETGVVDFVVQEKDLYGIGLINTTNTPLYVRMFYFDTTDFSIVHMFGHSVATGTSDPDLRARAALMIGDGRDGGEPLTFGLNPSEKVDLGYMKVFWSTDPLELGNVEQESAFEMEPQTGESRKVLKSNNGPIKDWGTLLLTLVQRAPEVA